MCPLCRSKAKAVKRGYYLRPSDNKRFQRFQCKVCRKTFSEQIFGIEYRLRRRENIQRIYRVLCRGMSQRAVAEEFSMHRDAIATRIMRFGRCSRSNLEHYRENREKVKQVQIDELITFEHTKCKPLTVPIAVEEGSRKILALKLGQIPASGHLAVISRRRYGHRKSERIKVLNELFQDLKMCVLNHAHFKSDEAIEYPPLILKHFPGSTHSTFKGRRAAIAGLGELKKGGFDPLFSLNHTYAMFRDNLKRLSRRTWTTTKNPAKLELMLFMYAWFHNLRLDRKKGQKRIPVSLTWVSHLHN